MKLLYCPHCQDVRKLALQEPGLNESTFCDCGKSWGYYTDDINAVYGGDAVMLGFSNHTLAEAMRRQQKHGDQVDGMGRQFVAFVIPESAPTVRRER